MPKIALLDYGMGNLHSVHKALEHVGAEVDLICQNTDVSSYDAMILPGVGHFGDGMKELGKRGLVETIQAWNQANKPFLGICLGLQMLFETSEEAPGQNGLGLLPGTVCEFEASTSLRVPQMGWNKVKQIIECPLFKDIPQDSFFYFVHSFYVKPSDSSVTAGTTVFGQEYCSFAMKQNLFGAQFHPEKSQTVGLQMLTNFINLLT